MKLCVLGSGSKGQAVYVQAGRTRVLFDAGFTGRELKRRLAAVGADLADIDAIVLSHEHGDHVAGLRALGKKLPVYATEGTLAGISHKFVLDAVEIIAAGDRFELGDLTILPVSVSHDAEEPVAFVIEDGRARAAVVTDLGFVTRPLLHHLADLDLAVIEANHDLKMLMDGPYPWDLKQRIKSRHGHLSNAQTAEFIAAIAHSRLKHIMLAHLSQQNNLPRLARDEVQLVLDGADCAIQVCCQGQPARMVEAGK